MSHTLNTIPVPPILFRAMPLIWHTSALTARGFATDRVTGAATRFAEAVSGPGLVASVKGLPDREHPHLTAYRIVVHIDEGKDAWGVDLPLVELVASVTIRPKGDSVKAVVRLAERAHESVTVPMNDAPALVWEAARLAVVEPEDVTAAI